MIRLPRCDQMTSSKISRTSSDWSIALTIVSTVPAQIAWPLTHGHTRDVLTVVTVVLFFLTSASHALLTRGFFFIGEREIPIPPWLRQGLRYAPLAALAASCGLTSAVSSRSSR